MKKTLILGAGEDGKAITHAYQATEKGTELKKPLEKLTSFVSKINGQHVQQAVAAFDKALSDMTRATLEAKGFIFESEGDFKIFCRDRLTVISFEENEFRKEMYLDCISPDAPGTFLFKFSTEITTKYENGVLTTTFG